MAVVKGKFNHIIENTNNTLIAITEDKLKLIISRHIEIAKKQHDWIGLIGVFITIVISLLTCKFEDFWGITNSGIFMFCFFFIVAIIIAVFTICHFFKREETSVDVFLCDVKKDEV